MARKVIIDCDPGIDDALAMCIALFDSRLEVVAVTAVPGNVSAEQASLNVQAIIDQLDPPRLPRVGTASPIEDGPAVGGASLHGADGLGNAELPISPLHHQHGSDKLIGDEIHAAPDEVTIICLGPLTNMARVLRRDPEVASLVSQIVIAGGSVGVGGNVTPAAEFNIYCDPVSAQMVFQSPITKTVIPLDVTRQVCLTLDVMDELPARSTNAGSLLRKMLPYAFRAHHQVRGEESILIQGVVALLSVLHPELFGTEEIAGDVEVGGTIAEGATVFDRRVNPLWRNNMEVAMTVDATAVKDCIVRGLRQCGAGG